MKRLQNIVSKYNDVDPEEHRLLKLKLEEQSAAATQAAAGFAQHVTDLETKFKETFDELAAAKTRSTVSTHTYIYTYTHIESIDRIIYMI